MNITALINEHLSSMTKSEYKVALFCMNNADEVAFATLEELAAKIDTSTTSVIRFCRRLGFLGYKEMQISVRDSYKSQPSLPDKYERTAKLGDGGSLFSRVAGAVRSALDKTFDGLSEQTLSAVVKKLTSAERVYLFGMKESYALAHYAYTRLLTVRGGVSILSAGQNGEIEQLLSVGPGDACVVFLFHRYTDMALRVLEVIKERGASVVLVTSSPCEESISRGTTAVFCHTDIGGIKNSAVAPIAITDYICNAVAVQLGTDALEYMKSSEKLFDRFSVLSDK